MNLLETIAMLQGQSRNDEELIQKLAYLGEAPENIEPKVILPQTDGIPSFNVGGGIGGEIAGIDHAEPAPMFGTAGTENKSLGELLIGEQK